MAVTSTSHSTSNPPEGAPIAAPDVPLVLADTATALEDLLVAITDLLDADSQALAAPSHLDGWTRGHVLAHAAGIGNALARQAERAAHGALVDVYDGGAAGRAAGIETGARRSGESHLAELVRLRERLDAAWPAPGGNDWDAPVRYRDGTVAGVLAAWWREVRIHTVDLDAGVDTGSWSPELCEHLVDFLAVRATEPVVLVPDDAGVRYAVGPGGARVRHAPPRGEGDDPARASAVVVHGSLRDLTAWLAGRVPAHPPEARRDGERAALPELAPWPSALPVRT